MLTIEETKAQKEIGQKIIRRHMLFSAGLGFIPFPIIDTAAILGNQVLMISDLSDLYDIPFKKHRVKSFIGALVGNLGSIGLVKFIPGLGSLLGGATVSAGATAATYALGKIFMQHFDQGGTLLDFDPVKSRKYFQELHEEGKIAAQKLETEKVARKTKPSAVQNLKVKIPFVSIKKTDPKWAAVTKKPEPTTVTPKSSKIAQQPVAKKQSKPAQKLKPSIVSRLKWLLYLLLIIVLGWLGWQGYKKFVTSNVSESTYIPTSKKEQSTAQERTVSAAKTVETTKDSMSNKTVQD